MKTSKIRIGFGSLFLFIFASSSAAARTAQPGPTFTVNFPGDKDDNFCSISDCSLREAINAANTMAGANTINFAANITGTITLTLGELSITDAPLTITGPGARVLSVDGNLASRVLSINTPGGSNPVNISGLTFTRGQNTLSGSVLGGGILSIGQAVTLTNCVISDNSAVAGATLTQAELAAGGGIYYQGITTLIGCTFRGNSAIGGSIPTRGSSSAPGGQANGGAIMGSGTVVLQNCTFSNNTAQGGRGGNNTLGGKGGNGGGAQGGALILNGPMTNCTVIGNTATGGSGGLGNPAGANANGLGGGASNSTGASELTNTILAGNTATLGPDGFGVFTSKGSNLVGILDSQATGFNGPGDQTGTVAQPLDPKISPLANNGGPTDTMALLPGSTAINTGNSAKAPPRDQRNYLRSGTPDIGAYEFAGTIPVTLANISTRLSVDTGDNALIGGFIVTGTHDKRVIVLAVGPSLPFPDKLANPTLELYSGNTLLESNDDWVTSANKQAIMDSGAAPGNNLESAIIRTLPANNSQYTAIVRGANNGKGIGSVQVYDLDRTTDSKLANISTRGVVQAGDNIMIAGFIISGADQQKVIVLAVGPSLTVPGKLPDPTLQLVNQQGTILDENDNWGDSANKQAIIDSGVVPGNAAESAIIATLPSNNAQYTAIVRGVGGATGVAVVQVYALN